MDGIPGGEYFRASIVISPTIVSTQSTSSKPTYIPTPTPTQIAHSFGDIHLTTPNVDWFMNYLTSSDKTDVLWTTLLDGSAYTVSDESYFPTSQTCA